MSKAFTNLLSVLVIALSTISLSACDLLPGARSDFDYDNPDTAPPDTQLTKPSSQMQSEYWEVVLDSVHDGDTFRARRNGQEIKVRLACLDAPELQQTLGPSSRDFLRSLLLQSNQVILTIVDHDRYGRKVAEVFVPTANPDQERFVQYEMVKAGWAYPYEQYANSCPNWDQVQQAGVEAKQKRLGVWSVNEPKPWEWRKAKQK